MNTKDRRLHFIGLRPTGDLADLTCYTSKRNKLVWFTKAPPKKAPSDRQLLQRNRFRTAALAWRGLTQESRHEWNAASRACSLRIHGYNLWIYWQLVRDRAVIRTVEFQSGRTLLPWGTV